MKKYGFLYFLAFCCVLAFSSCDSFKKAQGDNGKNQSGIDPITGKKKDRNNKPISSGSPEIVDISIDTIQWTDDVSVPPITSSGIDYQSNTNTTTDTNDNTSSNSSTIDGTLLKTYNVAVMLPFFTDRFNTNGGKMYERSELAVNFYGGVKLAFQDLESEGLQLNVSVLDTKGSASEINRLLYQSEVTNAHLIVGPVQNDGLKLVAEFAQTNQVPLVSPISPSTIVNTENPYYVQVSPGLETHCKAITNHIRQQYEADQVVLICRNKPAEIRRLAYFQDANIEFSGGADTTRFKEYIISEILPDYSNIDLTPFLNPTKKTIFVIPSWSNESFVNTMLRIIRIAKSQNEVMVFGMPRWKTYQKISYDYYEDLNVHISEDTYINPIAPEVEAFRLRYYNEYGDIPTEEAFIGYDVTRYMCRMLNQHGTQFQQKLDQNISQYLHTKFAFEPIADPNITAGEEDFTPFKYENKFINILQFKDYYFQKVN